MKSTFGHCFLNLELGVTIENRPRQFNPKTGFASVPLWARAKLERGLSLVQVLLQKLSSQSKVSLSKL